MVEVNLVRQKVQAARQAYAKGDLHKARSLLNGLEHPKVQALLMDIEARISQNKSSQSRFPLMPVVGFLALLSILLLGGFVAFQSNNSSPSVMPDLPTLIPTSDCSFETVQTWWNERNLSLDSFLADASSASRTMQGERLTANLQNLRQAINDFMPPPSCASSQILTDYFHLINAMDEMLSVLERWSIGAIDGTVLSHDFYLAEEAFSHARQRLSRNFSE